MTEFPIPVVGLGPGSQGGDEGLELIGSPGEMAVFAPPRVSDNASAAVRAAALEELLALRDAMRATDFARGLTRDMRGLTPAVRALVNEALGEGEVAITVQGPGRLRVQETVFAGVWRVLRDATDGQPAVDRVEAGAMPAAVIDAARAGTVRQATALAQPAGVMNAPAILAELNERRRTSSTSPCCRSRRKTSPGWATASALARWRSSRAATATAASPAPACATPGGCNILIPPTN